MCPSPPLDASVPTTRPKRYNWWRDSLRKRYNWWQHWWDFGVDKPDRIPVRSVGTVLVSLS